MKVKSIITNKTEAPLIVFLITLAFILWEYFNGGVVTHHLLARGDMPGFSNWWGLLTVPILFWVGVSLINRRQVKGKTTTSDKYATLVFKRFLAALAFGMLLSLLWKFKFVEILQYLILLPLVMAIFIPVYFPEYLMGFVLGMAFIFGGVLPVLIGLILVAISFLINKLIGFLRSLLVSKT